MILKKSNLNLILNNIATSDIPLESFKILIMNKLLFLIIYLLTI